MQLESRKIKWLIGIREKLMFAKEENFNYNIFV